MLTLCLERCPHTGLIPHCLPSLHSHRALKIFLQHFPHPSSFLCLPSLCSHHALLTFLQCLPHTSLILNAAYHSYAPAVPSRCDSDSALTTP
ncbi:hypothetical protein O181_002744 [Austropuccinia psidii MF-1]|uniref:Uncharacterized protein n=1 Tax=Austropuccinia psidii MF-1 TaxID=1389203 RepID=A0A9Q3GD55_9BASI|nr:hypothetical protein [Austropuccinia psidii MF-1]